MEVANLLLPKVAKIERDKFSSHMNKKYLFEIAILVLAFIMRFSFIGIYPPLGVYSSYQRFFSAFCGVLSIGLLIQILEVTGLHKRISIFSGLALTLMPWHLEQSRIYSAPMILLVGYMLTYLGLRHKSNLVKIGAILLCGISTYLFFIPTWGGIWNAVDFDIKVLLNNIFHLVSVQFWFFNNDSSWVAGMRERGVSLTSTLPVFVFGLSVVFRNFQLKHCYFLIPLIGAILISALNPLFPEGRLIFLLVPIAAMILGIGIDKIFSIFVKAGSPMKIIIFLYLLFLTYDYLIFGHFYIHHYTQRILYSVPYEERTF